ncbi:hypothetical protein F4820DRAFT_468012 [Hypoxylon rubiginosum]|uniref:Uncharacterized protein n=1 Tax=Hypoxylon rubiginosum TaxID=110542 RepID=A0ACB9YHT1_9PEZI|nr:hypothetical protein F4820DRAFT_468012 [Hypoxylon rubiginosum]
MPTNALQDLGVGKTTPARQRARHVGVGWQLEVAVPSTWTVRETSDAEEKIRTRVGSKEHQYRIIRAKPSKCLVSSGDNYSDTYVAILGHNSTQALMMKPYGPFASALKKKGAPRAGVGHNATVIRACGWVSTEINGAVPGSAETDSRTQSHTRLMGGKAAACARHKTLSWVSDHLAGLDVVVLDEFAHNRKSSFMDGGVCVE